MYGIEKFSWWQSYHISLFNNVIPSPPKLLSKIVPFLNLEQQIFKHLHYERVSFDDITVILISSEKILL